MQEKVTLMDLFNRQHSTAATPQKPAKKAKPSQRYGRSLCQPLIRGWSSQQDLVLAGLLENPRNAHPWVIQAQIDALGGLRWSVIMGEQFPRHPDQCRLGHHVLWVVRNYFITQKRLQLADKLINNGIAFVWGASGNVGELFDYFTEQGFLYVENFMFVMLDRKKIPAKKKTALSKNSLLNYFKKTATKD